jgi:transposase InsO family protein
VSKARLVITAVVVEGRSQSEVARSYGVCQPWISRLVARYRAEGEAAFEPGSRRPRSSPNATPQPVVERVLALRAELSDKGLDAGPHTICWHLANDSPDPADPARQPVRISAATVSRILTRHGVVVPDPSKRPKSADRRFQAELPNQVWQSDFTHWQLADGSDVEILNWLDDHSRYLLGATVHRPVTGPIVVAQFRAVIAAHGVPAAVLTDNGLVYTTRFAGGRRGRTTRNGFEQELAALGVEQKNSSPNHPQTCGKVERFHQTLKKWLAAQPPARSRRELQAQLDTFRAYYNEKRPHRALGRSKTATPAAAHAARPKATPTGVTPTHERVRRDRIDDSGVVTLRHHLIDWPAPPHRHRTNPRPNPRPPAHPGPQRPRHRRGHRRAPPRPHPRPHQGLPTPKRATRPQTHKIRTLMWVRIYAYVVRHHTRSGAGFEPATSGFEVDGRHLPMPVRPVGAAPGVPASPVSRPSAHVDLVPDRLVSNCVSTETPKPGVMAEPRSVITCGHDVQGLASSWSASPRVSWRRWCR